MNTIAVYAGSFNPFHVGHLNIVRKAEDIFGRGQVIVARGINPDKLKPQQLNKIDLKDWQVGLEKAINVTVHSYAGYLHEYLNFLEEQGLRVVLLRGLRNATDLAYEENQLKFIREFKPDIRSIFMMCDPEYNHISSSAIRSMQSIKPGSGNRYTVSV